MATNYFSLATGNFSQDWSNIGLISANDDWSLVPSIVGYLGDYTPGTPTAVDPGSVTGATLTTVDVIANQTNPNTNTSGGVAEFQLADPTIALQGSGTADAPNLVLYLDATGRQNVTVSFNLRDIDGSTDNAVQQIAVQYRTSPTAEWINLPAGAVADATAGPSLAGGVIPVSVVLPASANNAAKLEVRVITTNAAGNDEWVGVDDIRVTSEAQVIGEPGILSIGDAGVIEGDAGTTGLTFTVTREGGAAGAISATWAIGFGTASADDLAGPLTGTISFADGETAKTITVQIVGDTKFEPNETFAVALSAPTGGATLGDAEALGTIRNDDAQPSLAAPFINEIHYDNSGADIGEAVEIAGAAGTDLAGWSLAFYNGNGGAVYATVALSGVIPNQDDGYGALAFAGPAGGIQNGAPDGIALVNAQGQVVQFLSYEGVMTATNGPANGLTSTDIGVAEEPAPGAGGSLQRVGVGAVAGDFTWVTSGDDSFGTVNSGQDFIGDNATGQVSIGDARVDEGDAGTQQLVFTVRRAGGLGQSATVDWLLNLNGSANAADLASGQPLSGQIAFAPGVSSVTISIGVAGDTVGESNETFNLLLANPAGNIAIVDGTAVGTILNDDPIALATFEIQGARHGSEYVGQSVITSGIVTAVDSNGFYLQDPNGDGNLATSDGLFVFTGAKPSVAIGDAVEVKGIVSEFLPGNDAANLTVTQLNATATSLVSTGNALPAAVLIGTGGRLPPTETIEDDGFTSFDPTTDGLDFYESLEGMRVTIDAPLVVAQTNGFGETDVVASGGVGATGVNARGGITISGGDYNPEKIQIDDDAGLFAGYSPAFTQGDRLSSVTGIVSYSFNNYEVLVTEAVALTQDVTLGKEVSALDGDGDNLSIASMNVENLSPADSAQKFDLLAANIVFNLSAPDIIAVQEVQDGNGVGGTDPLSGAASAQGLIDAILRAGGPDYVYVEIAPAREGDTGGAPGGNIRNGFFYNPDRVSLVEGGLSLIEDPAFAGTRRPLVGTFLFNGQEVTLVNVHFTSRGGSDPLNGSTQPPDNAGDARREDQAEAVAKYVNDQLAIDPALKLAVAGDYNAFYFEATMASLHQDGVFTNLYSLLPEEERYSYLFEGNLQGLDNMVVTGGLLPGARFDAVHTNSEQPDALRSSDHDQILATFFIPEPNDAPEAIVIDDANVDENAPAGTLVGTVRASDADGDVLAYTLTDNADGLFDLDAATGALTTTASFDFEGLASYDVTVRATDPDGAFAERVLTISVKDVNETPVAVADAVAVDEDATSANLWDLLLGNDRDPDAGDTLAIKSVDGTGTLGSLVFDAASQTLRYVADNDAFDALAPGASVVDRFTYTVTDADGLTSTATVEVTVTGIADGIALNGGNGSDQLLGTSGEDSLFGGNGSDVLRGLAGHDLLSGGNGSDQLFGDVGNDRLVGGNGEDILSGGAGRDQFVFGRGGGKDTILDFDVARDEIVLEAGIALAGAKVGDVNGDGIADLSLAFTRGGGGAVLLGVSDLAEVTILSTSAAHFAVLDSPIQF